MKMLRVYDVHDTNVGLLNLLPDYLQVPSDVDAAQREQQPSSERKADFGTESNFRALSRANSDDVFFGRPYPRIGIGDYN